MGFTDMWGPLIGVFIIIGGWDYPKIPLHGLPGLVNKQFAIEHGHRNSEIVDLPSYKMVIFHSYVSLPEGISDGK